METQCARLQSKFPSRTSLLPAGTAPLRVKSKKMRPVVRVLGVKNLQLYADVPRGARAAGKQQREDHNKER